jgi:hypothetical protein
MPLMDDDNRDRLYAMYGDMDPPTMSSYNSNVYDQSRCDPR